MQKSTSIGGKKQVWGEQFLNRHHWETLFSEGTLGGMVKKIYLKCQQEPCPFIA